MKATAVVQPFDSSMLIDIYLDGFVTGAASLAVDSGWPDAIADEVADRLCDALKGDPAAMEQVRTEVLERLRGIRGAPHNFTAFTAALGETS